MSEQRRTRRQNDRDSNSHYAYLGELLGGFYEFLSGYETKTLTNAKVNVNPETGTYKPSDEQIRAEFIARNENWEQYCKNNKLMKQSHLFKLNVSEAWKRSKKEIQQ